MASSRDFRKTVKTVSKNFEKYTEAMETDIQVLITCMLEVIEMKIVALRRLLKLKLCIKNVRNIAGLECLTRMEDMSLNTAPLTISEKKEDIKKDNGSLEDLSSMVYEVDKHSLPKEDNVVKDEVRQKKIMYVEDIADIESLCSALNHHNSKMGNIPKEDPMEDQRDSLDKYIYMLLDAERQKCKYQYPEENGGKPQNIGDFAEHSEGHKAKPNKSHESVVYLGKSDYQSILDILNMVLRSYKMQEEIAKRNRVIEKTKTEPFLSSAMNETDQRKIVSDSFCQQKDGNHVEKKQKSRKYTCV